MSTLLSLSCALLSLYITRGSSPFASLCLCLSACQSVCFSHFLKQSGITCTRLLRISRELIRPKCTKAFRGEKTKKKKKKKLGKQSQKKTIISTWAGLQQQSTPPRPALLECLSACDSIRRSDSIVWCRGKTTGGCEHEGVIDSCLNATARSGTQAAITTENKHHCPCRHEAMECGGERVRPTLKVPFTTANRKQHSVEHQTL